MRANDKTFERQFERKEPILLAAINFMMQNKARL